MEAVRQILSQLNATFSNLSFWKKITLVTLILGSMAGFVFLMSWTGKAEFQPLYAQLDAEDASAILSKLREQKIEYRIASNGSTILIPHELIYETRMQLASEGIPRGSGVGYISSCEIRMVEPLDAMRYSIFCSLSLDKIALASSASSWP